MRLKPLLATALAVLAAATIAAAQDPAASNEPARPEPLFVRLTFYPTASLSRYDYNNDLDVYEVRVYAEVRRRSQEGAPAADARVTAFGQKLEFLKDHFEKRVLFDKDKLPAELVLEISIPERPVLRERHPLPAWLALTAPAPSILPGDADLAIRWAFSRFPSPVDLRAYDFKTGKEFFSRDHLEDAEAVVPAADVPGGTIVRVYAIQSWLYKRYLAGPDYARGSEINVIPWSQVFVRTK
jgi:hypothetical protein